MRDFTPSVAALCYFDRTAINSGPAANVGETVGGQSVHIAAPADRGRPDDAFANSAVDVDGQDATSAIVKQLDTIAGGDATPARILFVQEERGRLVYGRALVAESGIHAVVAFGGNHFER